MLLFRSEEHLERWLAERNRPRGATMSVEKQWRLASEWYGNRLELDWRRRTPEEVQQAFEELGLTGTFWNVT